MRLPCAVPRSLRRRPAGRRTALLTAAVLCALPLWAAGASVDALPPDRPAEVPRAADDPVNAAPAADDPDALTGWATEGAGTTGGEGADADSTHLVTDRAELAAALDNGGAPEAPKIIRVRGEIHGNETDDGRLLQDQDYAPGWDLERYMACFGPEGTEWSDDRHPWCAQQRKLRTTGSNAQKAQIQLTVPSNTTLVGEGAGAALLGVYLSVNTGQNIILRDLHLEAPTDHFPSWDPWDGDDGSWNARFDAMSVVTGSHLWVDHCTFTDGRYPNSEAPEGFHGEPVERHDGLLDLEDGTDFVTVSYSRFVDHAKTMLVGSGDGQGDKDRGHLRITFHHNLFEDTVQRSPRVRFGQVHSYNNYFTGSTDDPDYPLVSEEMGGSDYFLGMGLESRLVSERNAFELTGPGASADIVVANLGGHQFRDTGSWFGGEPVDVNALAERKFLEASERARGEAEHSGSEPPAWALEEFTTDVGWDPAEVYPYQSQTSPEAVRRTVLGEAGPRG